MVEDLPRIYTDDTDRNGNLIRVIRVNPWQTFLAGALSIDSLIPDPHSNDLRCTGKEVIKPQLENEQRPKLFVMRHGSGFVLAN